MPRVDFSNVNDINDFAPLPDGEYLVRVADIETDSTRAGDQMWKLRWIVEGGEHAGRLLFDNLVFSPKAMPRVKLICASFGLDVSGVVDLDPSMLLEKRALVSTYLEEYEDDRGQQKVPNRIPYDGYAPCRATTTRPVLGRRQPRTGGRGRIHHRHRHARAAAVRVPGGGRQDAAHRGLLDRRARGPGRDRAEDQDRRVRLPRAGAGPVPAGVGAAGQFDYAAIVVEDTVAGFPAPAVALEDEPAVGDRLAAGLVGPLQGSGVLRRGPDPCRRPSPTSSCKCTPSYRTEVCDDDLR